MTDVAGHPDVEELSDLSEGLLPPSRTADVQRHLNDCGLCADVYGSLKEIRGLLGAIAAPPHMPDDVAGRIDAALAAETPPDAATHDTDSDSTVVSSVQTAATRVSRETSPSSLSDRPSGHAQAATGPGRTKRTRRGSRKTITLGAVLTAAALGLGTLLMQTLSDDAGTAPRATQQHTDAAHTYSEGTLQSQVADLLATSQTRNGHTGGRKPWNIESDSDTTGPTGQRKKAFQDTVQVPTCIAQGVHGNETVLAAGKGVYQGRPVYLVVTPDSSDTSKVTAYIVDATCMKQASGSPGKVLLTRSYSRS